MTGASEAMWGGAASFGRLARLALRASVTVAVFASAHGVVLGVLAQKPRAIGGSGALFLAVRIFFGGSTRRAVDRLEAFYMAVVGLAVGVILRIGWAIAAAALLVAAAADDMVYVAGAAQIVLQALVLGLISCGAFCLAMRLLRIVFFLLEPEPQVPRRRAVRVPDSRAAQAEADLAIQQAYRRGRKR